jgi:hypothetical protein
MLPQFKWYEVHKAPNIARVLDYEKIIVQAPITINMAHSEATVSFNLHCNFLTKALMVVW